VWSVLFTVSAAGLRTVITSRVHHQSRSSQSAPSQIRVMTYTITDVILFSPPVLLSLQYPSSNPTSAGRIRAAVWVDGILPRSAERMKRERMKRAVHNTVPKMVKLYISPFACSLVRACVNERMQGRCHLSVAAPTSSKTLNASMPTG
jgi:hypothetical protein